MNMQADDELFDFLSNAPKGFVEHEPIRKFELKNGDLIHCVLWKGHFYVTGTDIVKTLVWRFQDAGRQIGSLKKFEEGVFSDLRNLKPGIDATLEGPRSEFLEFLHKNGCIRTQKKQKVFFWYSVPHDALFCDALERDLRRETNLYAYSKYYNKQMYTSTSQQVPESFQAYADAIAWQQNAQIVHPRHKNMQAIVIQSHPGYGMGMKGAKTTRNPGRRQQAANRPSQKSSSAQESHVYIDMPNIGPQKAMTTPPTKSQTNTFHVR